MGWPARLHAGPQRRPARDAVPRARTQLPDARTRSATTSRPTRRQFELPVRLGVHVDSLDATDDGGFVICAGDDRFEAAQVVVATGGFSEPRIPEFASELRSGHHPAPLERVSERVAASGRAPSWWSARAIRAARSRSAPLARAMRPGSRAATPARCRSRSTAGWRASSITSSGRSSTTSLTVRTPLGRKARPAITLHGGPLERVRKNDLEAAGVTRLVGRTVGVARWAARSRGRAGARRPQRRLGHRLPPRVPLDPRAGHRSRRLAGPRARRRRGPCPASTSSGCRSSTRSRHSSSAASAAMPASWSTALPSTRLTGSGGASRATRMR